MTEKRQRVSFTSVSIRNSSTDINWVTFLSNWCEREFRVCRIWIMWQPGIHLY